jgi:hypothetical protein
MSRNNFKEQWKELRIADVSYDSLTNWLKAISNLKKEGVSDQEITDYLIELVDRRRKPNNHE